MKTAIVILAVATLSACAPMQAVNPKGETLLTTTRCYDASVAARAGATQSKVAACIDKADVIFWRNLATGPGGGLNCVEAGNTFEACVKR